jgi:hypothetical protein
MDDEFENKTIADEAINIQHDNAVPLKPIIADDIFPQLVKFLKNL